MTSVPRPPEPQWQTPSRTAAAWRSMKSWLHIARRMLQNQVHGPRRILRAETLRDAPIIAEQRSALWQDGRADEFILRCGKVQNLRVALKGFDGIELEAGQVLSFWAQVGRPAKSRGFAIGREIISGCVVPTIGGGLCQLSNGLAALALEAGAQLLEQHRHSALIQEQNTAAADATVAWNYIDLRIQADFAFRLEAELTQNELVLRMRARRGAAQKSSHIPLFPLQMLREERPVARGCLSCNESACFRHQPQLLASAGSSAFLLNEYYPELAQWLAQYQAPALWMRPWLRARLRARSWQPGADAQITTALWPGLKRAARLRLLRGESAARQALRTRTAHELAQHYARRLQAEHTELVITQELLVPLWRSGALGGRAYDVYVHDLPVAELQMRLDAAAALSPDAASLRDFRLDQNWQRDEWRALARARSRITPHHEVHRVLQAAGLPTTLLPWVQPKPRQTPASTGARRLTLTLAASALARKGAHEVAFAARALQARVLILGSAPTEPGIWQDIDWTASSYASDWLAQSDAVLLPAYIEHQPRALLQALQAGIPVLASSACGLGPQPGLYEVAPGDAPGLLATLRACLAIQQ